MTLKARITKNSLTVAFLQQILIFKESLELILTDVAMTTLPPAAELCWDLAAEGLWWDCRPYQENRLKKMIEMKVRGKKYPQSFLLERKRIDVPNEVCNMRCHLWKEHQWRPCSLGELTLRSCWRKMTAFGALNTVRVKRSSSCQPVFNTGISLGAVITLVVSWAFL